MVVYLQSGHLTAVNLTETRVRVLQQQQQQQQQQPQKVLPKDEALASMEATPAFYELLQGPKEQIEEGLLNLTRIVGSATPPQDIDASLLATALSIKQHCEENVMVPLRYLAKLQSIRQMELKNVMRAQTVQIKAVQSGLQDCQHRLLASRQGLQQSQQTALKLARRSSALLQAAKDLRPALTKADRGYFRLLQRIKAQIDEWTEQMDVMEVQAAHLDTAVTTLDLTPIQVSHVQTLLRGQEETLEQTRETLERTQERIHELVRETGIAAE
jgi:hypothetical protein